ncbi:MAG TPA: alpha-glucosidase/alpha-galactosidase [Candidatus Limnocylindrales bacterium]|nr:alpha-glucosidase/alpha-galactosidase [Candidatus Limnocylindrales bacterium]
MTRIVLVGAGSVEFTRNLLGDILSYPELADANIVLHDIDGDRLATAEKMARWTASALGANPTLEAHLDRRAALTGADFVIDTIQVGGARATQLDFEIPRRYGLQYTINDTINVGGVMRGLRSIPVILGIVRDMEELCPGAWFLNYTNPMSMIIWAVTSASDVKTVGLCHSVYWTVHAIAGYVGAPFSEIEHTSAGVNHLAFLLRLEHRGDDLYPRLDSAVRDGRIPDDDLVRAELYKRLGFYPTESSEHHAEYNPWFIPKGQVERFHIPIGEYLDRVARNLDEFGETKRKLAAGEPFEIERSGEYAAVIIHSLTTGEQARIVGNVPNRGVLIPNLAAEACVEVPCIVDGSGLRPLETGALPPQLAAYIHPAVDAQGLTVKAVLEQDRDAIYHAVMQDPIVQARLTLDDTWRMTDELIEAEAEWLPAWLGGAAPVIAGM